MTVAPFGGITEFVIYAMHLGDSRYRYVGITAHLRRRMSEHRHAARKGRKWPLYNWIRKHGPENIYVDILQEGRFEDYQELRDWEVVWITSLRRSGFDLLNVTEGGEGRYGVKVPQEQIDRQRATYKKNHQEGGHPKIRRIWTVEQRARISEGVKKAYEEGRLAPPNLGKPMSDESKRKLSESKKGTVISAEHRAKLSAAHDGMPRNARVTEDDVRVIRQRVSEGEPITRLMEDYGLDRKTIYNIKTRRTWKWVT